MSTFLNAIAAEIHKQREDAWHSYTIILPGRRGGLFLSKALLSMAGKPILAPEILNPFEVFMRASELQQADDLIMLSKLYQCHKRISGSQETFSDFFPWGEKLLKDFDSVDKAMADSAQVFATIKSEREIVERFGSLDPEKRKEIQEFWMGFQQDPTAIQLRFLKLWECLPEIYSQFRASLEAEGLGYSGLIQRQVIEQNRSFNFGGPVWVAGFSGLSACERELFLKLKQEHNARFFWDDLTHFPPSHPARQLIHENLEQFGGSVLGSGNRPKHIKIVQADREEGQAHALSHYLVPGIDSGVVFSRASLLPAVLEHLDEEHLPVNISMGYPMRFSLISTFLDALHSLWKLSRGGGRVARLPLLHALTHPFSSGAGRCWQAELSEQKTDFVSLKSLPEPDTYEAKIALLIDAENPIPLLLSWLPSIQFGDGMEGQAILAFVYRLRRLSDVLQLLEESLEPETVWRLVQTLVRNAQLPLTGEPLSGTQMLGLLETSVLDFKRLYVLQTNEGTLPSSAQDQSLIPYHVRLAYGLQLPEQTLAEEAYLFFRLCGRAEEIVLLYNGTQQGTEKAEPSRFLLYLEQLNPWGIEPEHIYTKGVNAPEPSAPVSIPKSPEVMSRLDAMRERFSPTALNTYMYCSLRFAFKHILLISEKIEPEEGVDPRVFGDLLHNAMDHLYKQHLGLDKWIEPSEFESLNNEESILQSINAVLPELLGKPEGKAVDIEGEWVLVVQAVTLYMAALLKWDAARAPIRFHGLEQRENLEVMLSDGRLVNLGGIVDRIDYKRYPTHEALRILDYKTGSDVLFGGSNKRKFDSVSQLFDRDEPRRGEIMQVLLYSLILEKAYPDTVIEPGLVFLRAVDELQTESRLELGKEAIDDVRSLLPEFREALTNLLHEIYDNSVPFTQIEDLEKCAFCPYKAICGR
jgi:hypothetical protein